MDSTCPGNLRQRNALLFVLALAVLATVASPVMAGEPAGYAPKEMRLPSPVWVLPFVGMLLCISLLPLLPHTHRWWESNWAKLGVAATLAFITAGYYLFRPFGMLHSDAQGHKHVTEPGFSTLRLMLDHALLSDYVPFVVLLFSLYVISGGVQMRTRGDPTPTVNTLVLGLAPPLPASSGQRARRCC